MEKMRESIGKAAGKIKRAGAALTGDKGILRTLKEQHAEVSVLMKQVNAGGESARRQLFPKIRESLVAHAKAEQETFYAALDGHELARTRLDHSVREHQQMEQLVEQLHTTPTDAALWEQSFDQLVKVVNDHVREEEDDMFPIAKQVLSEKQLHEIESQFETAYAREKRLLHDSQ